MNLRRMFPLMLALLLIMSAFSCAQAQTLITGTYPMEGYNIDLNTENGNLVIPDPDVRGYMVITPDGQRLSPKSYPGIYSKGSMFEVMVDDSLNNSGLLDAQGNEIIPAQYGDIEVYSDRWAAGIKLVEATAENYDYKNYILKHT